MSRRDRLSNRVFGVDDDTGDRVAEALGMALQLTNILRDVREDSDRRRVYLPHDVLARLDIPETCARLAETTEIGSFP